MIVYETTCRCLIFDVAVSFNEQFKRMSLVLFWLVGRLDDKTSSRVTSPVDETPSTDDGIARNRDSRSNVTRNIGLAFAHVKNPRVTGHLTVTRRGKRPPLTLLLQQQEQPSNKQEDASWSRDTTRTTDFEASVLSRMRPRLSPAAAPRALYRAIDRCCDYNNRAGVRCCHLASLAVYTSAEVDDCIPIERGGNGEWRYCCVGRSPRRDR